MRLMKRLSPISSRMIKKTGFLSKSFTTKAPELSYFGVSTHANGMRSDIKVTNDDSGFSFVVDEPESLGGTNTGPNPMDYLAGAAQSCSQVMIHIISQEENIKIGNIYWTSKVGIDLRGLMAVEGTIVEPQTLDMHCQIECEQHNTDKLQSLLDKVQTRCPIYVLCKKAGININQTFEPKIVEKL